MMQNKKNFNFAQYGRSNENRCAYQHPLEPFSSTSCRKTVSSSRLHGFLVELLVLMIVILHLFDLNCDVMVWLGR